MALKVGSVWGRVSRPWGFEVRVDFMDPAGVVYNETLTFEKEPDEKALDAAVAMLVGTVEARLVAEAAAVLKTPELTREDLVAKVAVLEAEKVALMAERDALVATKPAVEVRR